MVKKKNQKLKNLEAVEPENLRVKYRTLLDYINSIVTYRFTTLGFFLAAVALIFGGKSSFEKYFGLAFITIALYIIELRNRFLKNDLEALARQIEQEWGYFEDKLKLEINFLPKPTYIFTREIKYDKKEFNESKITHGLGLDLLYGFIFVYAVIRIILLLYGIGR